jgi:exosortase
MTSPTTTLSTRSLKPSVPALIVMGCLIWAFWSTLTELAHVWKSSDQYSHGFLVPPFALFLLWLRRDRLDREALRPGFVLGGLLLALGIGLRLVGVYWYYLWLDTISILPCVAGVCWLLGGWAAWRWAWPAVLYLTFMIPLPYRFATAMSAPLQELATTVSTFIMQTIGLPALSEGNVIVLNEARIGVVEACSGLRMLVVFAALSSAMALLTRRPLVDKLILLVSAVPIAIVSNIIRIAVTGILHETIGSESANAFFHDLGGWLMMPLGLLMLAVELKILSHLFIELPPAPPKVVRDPALRRVRRKVPLQPRRAKPTAKLPQPQPELPPVTVPTQPSRDR